jgi:hypothetical protein
MVRPRFTHWLGIVVLVVLLALSAGPAVADVLPAHAAQHVLQDSSWDPSPARPAPTVTEGHFWCIVGLVMLGSYILITGDRENA